MNRTVADETQKLPPTHRHDTLPLALSPHTRRCHAPPPPKQIPSRRKQRYSDPRNHPTKPPSNLSTTGVPPSRGADKLRRGFLTPHTPSLLRNHRRQGKSEPVRDTIGTRSEAKNGRITFSQYPNPNYPNAEFARIGATLQDIPRIVQLVKPIAELSYIDVFRYGAAFSVQRRLTVLFY
ncbi:hypothetical protein YC2023_038740 [Brassica napus]